MLRSKSGLEGDGVTLVGQALGGGTPLIKLSPLQSESDWNLQRGIEQILRGIYQGIRNPRSHGKVTDNEEDAQTIILFVNYLLKLIGASRTPFTLQDYIARVLDKDFVANSRYAELLIDKLPPKFRLEVFHELFKRRAETDGGKLAVYFDALFKVLNDDERREVFATISDELATTGEEAAIRLVIHTVGPQAWPNLEELARLRVENKLLDSVRDGRFSIKKNRCESGALGTWTTSVLRNFSIAKQLSNVLIGKLESSDPSQHEYVYRYFLPHLDSIHTRPPKRLEALVIKRLQAGDARFHEALNSAYLSWEDGDWSEDVNLALRDFKPAEVPINPFNADDDDLPF
jgi:uncharacterized protein (TIGR02391 family)